MAANLGQCLVDKSLKGDIDKESGGKFNVVVDDACSLDLNAAGVLSATCGGNRRLAAPRRLLEASYSIGSKEEPKQYNIECGQNKRCVGGAAITYFAGMTAAFPAKDVESGIYFDLNANKVTVKLAASFSAEAGIALVAGGSCSDNLYKTFPEKPKIVLKACVKVICILVAVQGVMELEMEGAVSASASAYFSADYLATVEFEIDMNKASDPATATDAFNMIKQDLSPVGSPGLQSLNVEGTLNGEVSVKVGPRLTIGFLPGAFISFMPYVTAGLQVYGEFSASVGEGDKLELPEEITCGPKTIARRRTANFKKKSKTKSKK